ncbi:MAG: PPC domain-containing protein [Acidobacteriota bacterium]|nr:PPC domain-containing protein [Acidobacteriota bacterium]
MKKIWVMILPAMLLCAALSFAQGRVVLFPRFVSGTDGTGGQWTSEMSFTNQGFDTVSGIQVNFIDASGNDRTVTTNLGTNFYFTFDLAAGATQTLRVTPGSTVVDGHIRVVYPNFTSPVRGSLLYRYGKGEIVSVDVGVPQQEMGDHFSFPVVMDPDETRLTYTAVGLTNPMDVEQTFVVNLIGSDGLLKYTTTVRLGAFQHWAGYVDDSAVLFPQIHNLAFSGSLSVSSQFGAGVMTLRQDKNAFGATSTDGGPVIPASFLVTNVFATDADSTADYANDFIEGPQAVSLPVRISGSINYPYFSDTYPEDWDIYAFNGQAGAILTAVCDTTQISSGSSADTIVEVYDSSWNQIASNDQNGLAPGLYPLNDSFVQVALPYTGTYYVVVYDYWTDVGNATDYQYRLHLRTRTP